MHFTGSSSVLYSGIQWKKLLYSTYLPPATSLSISLHASDAAQYIERLKRDFGQLHIQRNQCHAAAMQKNSVMGSRHPFNAFLLLFFFQSVLAKDFIETGATTCYSCMMGSFASEVGLQSCQLCPPGYFSNSSSPTVQCVLCPPGTYSSSLYGSVACTPCPVGYDTLQNPGGGAPSIMACFSRRNAMPAFSKYLWHAVLSCVVSFWFFCRSVLSSNFLPACTPSARPEVQCPSAWLSIGWAWTTRIAG